VSLAAIEALSSTIALEPHPPKSTMGIDDASAVILVARGGS